MLLIYIAKMEEVTGFFDDKICKPHDRKCKLIRTDGGRIDEPTDGKCRVGQELYNTYTC